MATPFDQQTDSTHKGEFEEHQAQLPDHKYIGFDCEFVECPQEIDAYCPICLLVLREPHQVTCCGKSYCRLCIVRVELLKNPCPTCSNQNLSFFADKRLKQVLYAFRVRCLHKKEGCQWTGELGELDKHLNESPILGQQFVGCEFAEVECNDCCKPFQRQYFKAHQLKQHPFSCEYCHDYESYYEDVVKNHRPVCGFYPVSCPNECGVYPERQNLEHHQSKDCPLTVVDCDYCYAGCKVQLSRKDIPVHLAEDIEHHLALIAEHSRRKMEEKDKQIAKLKEELEEEVKRKSQGLRVDCTRELQQQLQETQDRMTKQLRDAEDRMARQQMANVKEKDEQISELKEKLKEEAKRKSHGLKADCTRELQQQLQETRDRMTKQLRDAEDRIARQQMANARKETRESGRYYFGITVIL